jgi:hypothetical protein
LAASTSLKVARSHDEYDGFEYGGSRSALSAQAGTSVAGATCVVLGVVGDTLAAGVVFDAPGGVSVIAVAVPAPTSSAAATPPMIHPLRRLPAVAARAA